MNILTIAAIGAGLFLLTGSKKSSSPKYIGSKLDKGFKIIVPCKEYDIYDEQAAYKWGYDELIKMIEFYQKNKSKLTKEDLAKIGDDASLKYWGCSKGQNADLDKNPKYYRFAFGMIKSMLNAFVDKDLISSSEKELMLKALLDQFTKNGFSIEGLSIY